MLHISHLPCCGMQAVALFCCNVLITMEMQVSVSIKGGRERYMFLFEHIL